MSEKVQLNLGCWTDIRPGFVNIDIQDYPGVNRVQDATSLSEWSSNTVDFIVAQHLLEYIPRKQMIPALTEWLRVLKKDAPLELRVTDLGNLTRSLYLNGISDEMGLHHEMVISLLYGKQKDKHDVRYSGFTSDFLQGVLVGIGYTINNVVIEGYDIIITAIK